MMNEILTVATDYQFSICNSNNTSPLGRTKTIPSKGDTVNTAVKIAMYSCSNYPFGFFNAFGNPARKDSVDYVIHLGTAMLFTHFLQIWRDVLEFWDILVRDM